MIRFREARREDVPAVVAMLADDVLGAARESSDMAPYLAAFEAMAVEGGNLLFVGEDEDGRIVATYQLILISGLAQQGMRKAELESVRVASALRGQGIGAALVADAEARARAAGCGQMQLASSASRIQARAFYERLGFTASHIGFKRDLSR